MSKAVGKILGAGGASTSMFGSEQEVLNYLNNYNTKNYDTTLNNMTSFAAQASNQLGNMGPYTFYVNGSDGARQRAEQASYQSYLDKLQPQFQQQSSDLAASLANKGIAVGSEAYSRAVSDLANTQNNALNQAAYQSVLAGQNAYSNSLNDQMNTANFSNQAQANYINLLLSALQNSYSGYDNALKKYQIQHGMETRIDQNKQANTQAQISLGNAAISGAAAALLSDERLKENITPVGKLFNGLTVYCFNFKGDETVRLGLIAQEVQETKPEAVEEGEDGFLRVRYDIACETTEKTEEEA